jgi:hypothetical protein
MKRVTAELALGLAGVFLAGAGGLSEIRLIALSGFFSNFSADPCQPQRQCSVRHFE